MAVSRKRHLAKAVTWRIVASLITVGATLVVTGSWKAGLSIGLVDALVKFAAYYYHERLWYKSRWGITENLNKEEGR
tara:strand:- start:117 stop:347 length:231 start_codon:yes stop_codon:yes gene_type:complete